MPLETFRIPIAPGFSLLVSFVQFRGQVISFSVVLLAEASTGQRDIASYDTAHGIPHRDPLGLRSGLVRKDWFPTIPNDEVLSAAITDFKANHENYHRFFEEH